VEKSNRSSTKPTIPKKSPGVTLQLTFYGLTEKTKIKGDGNCQFASVADQLFHNPSRHTEVRKQAVEWLRKNENYILPNTTTIGNYYLVSDTIPSWSHYVYYMSQPSVWGNHFT